jgi:hypothetical protein
MKVRNVKTDEKNGARKRMSVIVEENNKVY